MNLRNTVFGGNDDSQSFDSQKDPADPNEVYLRWQASSSTQANLLFRQLAIKTQVLVNHRVVEPFLGTKPGVLGIES